MSTGLSSVIAATALWLVRAYPPPAGALTDSLARAQARQATTVAAWLRYPTPTDAALLNLLGPGGADRLDWLVGADAGAPQGDDVWRTWVDEVVASWAACLLTEPRLATEAVAAIARTEHTGGLAHDFRRLLAPDERDRRAAALLRHPDLVGAVADLHRAELVLRLQTDPVDAG